MDVNLKDYCLELLDKSFTAIKSDCKEQVDKQLKEIEVLYNAGLRNKYFMPMQSEQFNVSSSLQFDKQFKEIKKSVENCFEQMDFLDQYLKLQMMQCIVNTVDTNDLKTSFIVCKLAKDWNVHKYLPFIIMQKNNLQT